MNDTLIRWYIREEVDYHLDLTREEIISRLASTPISTTEKLADADEIRTMSDKELVGFLNNAWEIANSLSSANDIADVFAEWEDDANNNGDVQGSLRDFLLIDVNNNPTYDPNTLLYYGEEIESGRMTLTNPAVMVAVDQLLSALDNDKSTADLNPETMAAIKNVKEAM